MNKKEGALPPVKKGAHIGILGGSFDPPHIGHQLLALSFLALEPIDELWVIPCANHAFKGSIADFSHRFVMCERAFRRIGNVRVLDIENFLPAPNYTRNTIEHILEHEPTLHIHLGIGSDLINGFPRWHDAEHLVEKARIVIFERDTYPVTKIPAVLSTARLHRGYALPDVNSTSLRIFSKSRAFNAELANVDRDVVQYIDEHNLYR